MKLSSLLTKVNKKSIFLILGITLILLTTVFVRWIFNLNRVIDSQLEQKRFSPPLELFSKAEVIKKGAIYQTQIIFENILKKTEFEKVEDLQNHVPTKKYFEVLPIDSCLTRFENLDYEKASLCYQILSDQNQMLVLVDEKDYSVEKIFKLPDFEELESFDLDPILFAQFYGREPILRKRISLGEVSPICLNAVLAIEDNRFLEHSGISLIGIGRAFFRNLFAGRVVQGGSTITQQLVKNYFLTHERTLERKFKEIFMALLLETKASKDEILEAYINEVYMGQIGSFQIRGFESASDYYFGKKLIQLNLPECALLAAIVNSPGLFNPFKNKERALERRALVLSKMLEQKQIFKDEEIQALSFPLPIEPTKVLSEPAPYFVDAVIRQLDDMGLDTTFGLIVETTMDIEAQEAAQNAVRIGIENIEKNNKFISKIKEETRKNLEGFLISADPKSGFITAIVGGRSFRLSQFNRAISSRRQVGSIMKPFVFYSALQTSDETGSLYTPTTLINDEKFKIKFDKQIWSPENYNNKYYGMIPLYFALKNSLNTATAKIGIEAGLDNIVDTARLAGVETELDSFPSITLGAFEISPMEVLRSYSTFANFGEKTELHIIRRIKTLDNEILYEYTENRESALDPIDTAVLVGMMKQTMINGTGAFARTLGFDYPSAGKTGTTSDYKDSWFAGFTPYHVAVTWVGYDDNTETKLTGASGALPIWAQYMKDYATMYPRDDFSWPEGVEKKNLSTKDQEALNIPIEEKKPLEPIELIFREE